MSNTQTHHSERASSKAFGPTVTCFVAIHKTITTCAALLLLLLIAPTVEAQQSATITPVTVRYWAGINTGATSNSVAQGTNGVVITGGNTNVFFVLTNLAPGVTNITFAPASLTNSAGTLLRFGVQGPISAGIYPMTILGVTNDGVSATNTIASASINLFVVPQWAQTNVNSTGNWSDPTKWSGGAAPLSTDSVYIDHTTVGPWTNVVDSSRTIQSLVYLGDADEGASAALAVNTTIVPGATLSVLGTNGFFIGKKTRSSTRPVYTFTGGGDLLVSNTTANFSIIDANPNATRFTRADFNGLNNLKVCVNRMAIADIAALSDGADGGSLVDFVLAKTNLIKATLTDDYNKAFFDTSISYMRGNQGVNNGQNANAIFRLGISTTFNADSIGIGIGEANGSGSGPFSNFGYRMIFNTANSVTPTNTVVFRNSDGVSPMSLLAIGVDMGLNTALNNNRGVLDLRGGITDMLVDKILLGQDRTNSVNANGKDSLGGLYFDWGTIECNDLIAGNMKYTNNIGANGLVGYVLVGTNGTLRAKNKIVLGQLTDDVTGFETQAGNVFGQLRIDNGGTVQANRIDVGRFSGNNQILLNLGGHLVLSNTIASATNSLPTLNVNGAKITLLVTSGVTNIFVTNLVSGATATVVNIASLTGFSPTVPATNVIIAYQDNLASHSLVIGSIPAGFNNITLVDNTASKTVELRIATNAPAVLKWRGGANSNWDHTSLNWQNTNTLAITRFFDGDSVIFDDSAVVPTSISVTEVINPGQVGTGIYVSNSVNAFTFTDGSGSIGNCSLVKDGPNDLTVSAVTSATAQINNGTLKGSSPGAVGGTTIASGASMNFGGTINGPLQAAGKATLASGGIAANTVQVLNGGVLTNSGSIQGNALTLDSGSFLYNATNGTLLSIGSGNSVNVATNATLVNEGNIGAENQANTLTVNGTFKDLGVGNIFLTTLTINGGSTFLPGGDGIGTTSIKSALVGSGFPGRMTLLAGSTTLIKVDFANAQTNTIVKAQYTDFGGNTAVKSFDGATILMTNVNTGAGVFAAGQSFRVFQNSDPGAPNGNIGNEGAGTTNRYPIVTPIIPAANTKWDLTNLRDTDPNGFINLVTFPTTGTNITFAAFRDSSNIVSHLQWPSEYIGWRLQELTNDLTSTNWITIGGSATNNDVYITNDAAIDETFFRMIYP